MDEAYMEFHRLKVTSVLEREVITSTTSAKLKCQDRRFCCPKHAMTTTTGSRDRREEDIPNINACPSELITFNSYSLCAMSPTCSSCTGQPTAAASNHEEVTLFSDWSHFEDRSREVPCVLCEAEAWSSDSAVSQRASYK